ncbi:hypothetical protein PV416_40050, partial [Streptomyces ipomoeae]|nr:hypothetical protein [Streptomyces ipomoeae]MDX2843030.1 hypothetical protein [Streptomyces ipomoeae]
PWLHARHPQSVPYQGGYDPTYDPSYAPEEEYEHWYEEQAPEEYQDEQYQQPEQFQQQTEQYGQQQLDAPEPQEPSPEETGSFPIPAGPGRTRELGEGGGAPEPDEDAYYQVFKQSINGSYPTPREFSENVEAEFSLTLAPEQSKRMVTRFTNRYNAELEEDHIA